MALSSGVEEVFLTRLDQPRRVPDAVQFEELRTLLESELNAFVAEFEATFTSNLPGPIQFVSRLAERWELSNAEIAALLGLDTPESASDVLRGLMSLRGRDAEDRLANLFRIFEALFGLLQDADEEKRWLRQPSDHFNGLTCLDVMLKGGIENLVDVRRWVEHLAGR